MRTTNETVVVITTSKHYIGIGVDLEILYFTWLETPS